MHWSIALPLPLPAYDFAPPPDYRDTVPLGCRVVVPWQGGLCIGLVVAQGSGGGRTRDAVALLEETPWIPPALVGCLVDFARANRLPLGLLVSDLLPTGWDTLLTHWVARVPDADLSPFGQEATRLDETLQDAGTFDAALLERVRTQGLLLEHLRPRPRTVSVYAPAPAQGTAERPALTLKQQVALQVLERAGRFPSLAEWARSAGVGAAVVSKVVSSGWAVPLEVEAPLPELPVSEVQGPPRSREGQNGGGSTGSPQPDPEITRLHGGSRRARFAQLGELMRLALERGEQVLYLVPDHASLERAWEALSGLAPALRFSGLLEGQTREHAWSRIQAGDFRLVIGTALALAAPLEHLALIVLEDEGSDAYKLQGGSRCFLPDLVEKYARSSGISLLLTGPAPAVESLRFAGLTLEPPRSRVHVVNYAEDREPPELGPLSRGDLKPQGHGWPLSSDLKQALRQVADRSRQGVLIAPRRGYSAVVQCRSCGHAPMCRNCDVTLKYSLENRQMLCHQCGYHEAPPSLCPVCASVVWKPRGPGSEWIAQEVRTLLPGFTVLRFDKDVQDDLSSVQQGKPAIVVGTGALLSQAAPPDLALIGLTFADTLLSVSDFRASERYHLLLRELLEWHPARAPLLIVQTFQADHPALKAVCTGQDAEFYPRAELEARRSLRYPPYARLAQLHLSARDAERARAAAQELVEHLNARGAHPGEVLGPAPSPVARVRGLYGYTVLLRTPDEARLEVLLALLSRHWPAKLRVDTSPRSFVGL